jgi:flagellar motor switch protein FliM
VPIRAVLESFTMSLREVMSWKVGTRIPLAASPRSDITMFCGEIPMFSGKMGRKAGSIAVRIDQKIEKNRGSA